MARRHRLGGVRRERFDTPDGDFIDVDWFGGTPEAPLLLVLHGLEGTIRSHYIGGLFRLAAARGWRAAVVYFRSCSGELNRLLITEAEKAGARFHFQHRLSAADLASRDGLRPTFDATARQAFTTYAALTVFFTGGAVVGAFATRAWSVHAIWIPAAVLFVTLILFVIDERKGVEP